MPARKTKKRIVKKGPSRGLGRKKVKNKTLDVSGDGKVTRRDIIMLAKKKNGKKKK
tara:strand:+ start:491 stop:658 length:168 start_codon:yes stop_codon:yes gene_type:complete